VNFSVNTSGNRIDDVLYNTCTFPGLSCTQPDFTTDCNCAFNKITGLKINNDALFSYNTCSKGPTCGACSSPNFCSEVDTEITSSSSVGLYGCVGYDITYPYIAPSNGPLATNPPTNNNSVPFVQTGIGIGVCIGSIALGSLLIIYLGRKICWNNMSQEEKNSCCRGMIVANRQMQRDVSLNEM
jgi:hypothetical protein